MLNYIISIMKIFIGFFLTIVFYACSNADFETIYTVQATDYDLVNSPVYVEITTTELDEYTTLCMNSKNEKVPAQIESITDSLHRIWWIVNQKAGELKKYKLQIGEECSSDHFTWNQLNNHQTRLSFGNQPLLQYEYPVYDSTDILTTHKAFHHVFDPTSNKLITKGFGGSEEHHKGIFFGYSKIQINDSQVNTWAAFNGERCEHKEILKEFSGPVMGGHIVKIIWKDQKGIPFIEEEREIRVFAQPKGESLIDFSTKLKTLDGDIHLKGDRHHAGVQFRAAQFVADNPSGTTFIRPAEQAHVSPDIEIDGDAMHDMSWDAMNFQLNGSEFTVAYLTHPSNPDNAEMSERRYGRIGEYFPYLLTKTNPLTAKYRFWIKTGDKPSRESIELKYKSYSIQPLIEKK